MAVLALFQSNTTTDYGQLIDIFDVWTMLQPEYCVQLSTHPLVALYHHVPTRLQGIRRCFSSARRAQIF